MEIIPKKKPRSANFSNEEKLLAVNIIANYKSTVENKKTDNVSVLEKTNAWNMIAGEFNSLSPNNIHRTAESLKKFFENKKKEVRKIVACEKKEISLTGGGTTPTFTKDPSHELVLSLMNNKSVFGLTNPFDSDSINNGIVLEVNNNSPGPSIDRNVKEKTIDGLFASTANDETILYSYEAQEDNECFEDINTDNNRENTWKKYKPTDLQAPVSSPLQRYGNENLTQENTPVRKNKSVNRRRPATTVKALTSSHLAEKYNTLVDKRLAIADMLTKKIVGDVNMQKEEHSLKTKLLQKKIELKEEKLKLLKKQASL